MGINHEQNGINARPFYESRREIKTADTQRGFDIIEASDLVRDVETVLRRLSRGHHGEVTNFTAYYRPGLPICARSISIHIQIHREGSVTIAGQCQSVVQQNERAIGGSETVEGWLGWMP